MSRGSREDREERERVMGNSVSSTGGTIPLGGGVQGGGRRASLTRRGLSHAGAALATAAGGGLALSACGAPNQEVGGGATGPSTAPATIRFHSRGGAPTSQEPMLYEEQMPLFMQKYPNIKVIHEGFTGEDFTA